MVVSIQRFLLSVALGCLVYTQPVFALSLEDAKKHGLVGEKSTGYLGLVDPANQDARALVDEVNKKRRQAYQDIARRDGANVSTVESLAGEKAIDKTKPGNYVEGSGGWIKK
ncbi:MAG: YdbL family protein [Nitrospira sp.]|nr:YdbL family protein [Nitrospira sp.]